MKNNLLSEKLVYTGVSTTPTHLHLCTYSPTDMKELSADSFKNIKEALNSDNINWVQVHGLKNTESIRHVCSHFGIDFLVLQDILNANHPTKIEEHENYIVIITKLFFPDETAKENLAVLDILNGKYADAAAKLANSDCCGNKALAYILTGQLDKASAAIKCACPASSYLKAVIAARQGNADEVKANLEKAGKDAKLAERAAKDIEFAQYR